jgi:3-mercaptopyruvate sulfurtransferase SseA
MVAVAAGIIVLTGCGEDLPEPPRFSGNDSIPADISEVPRITAEQVKQRLDAGINLVIVDVRSAEDFEDLHIAGALSIPEEEIAGRLIELYPYDEVVTYCR